MIVVSIKNKEREQKYCGSMMYKKDVLLNNSMNRTQSKNHEIEACEINKISLPCFHDKIYILDNRYDRLGLDY